MQQFARQIEAAAEFVRQRWPCRPRAGLLLGSGLGTVAAEISWQQEIDYAEIPYFPRTTVLGHRGRLVCGHLAGAPVMAFQGRVHLYEGCRPQQVSLPVRLLQALGAEMLLIFSAAGGLNPRFSPADLMLIEDQINLMFANPLLGANDEKLGPRFPDMSVPYDPVLMNLAAAVAREENFLLHRGVYAGMLGPTYETRAEYRMLRRLGGDAVGMSTVPEVLAARHAGIRVLGVAAIANEGLPDALTKTTGHNVLATAATAAAPLRKIVRGILRQG